MMMGTVSANPVSPSTRSGVEGDAALAGSRRSIAPVGASSKWRRVMASKFAMVLPKSDSVLALVVGMSFLAI